MIHNVYKNGLALSVCRALGRTQVNDIDAAMAAVAKFFDRKMIIVWSVEDVLSVAEDMDVALSAEEAHGVLAKLECNHDASIGINWTVIDEYVWDLVSKDDDPCDFNVDSIQAMAEEMQVDLIEEEAQEILVVMVDLLVGGEQVTRGMIRKAIVRWQGEQQ